MHQYSDYNGLVSTGEGMTIRWQNGPVSEGVNGALPELPIRAIIDRLTQLNEHVPCHENVLILVKLRECLALLDSRTRDRYHRGVMGTLED